MSATIDNIQDYARRTCYLHPKRPTGYACGRCERPICEECCIKMHRGVYCPACEQRAAEVPSSRRVRADTWQRTGSGSFDLFRWIDRHRGRCFALVMGIALLLIVRAGVNGGRDVFIVQLLVFGGWTGSVILHEFSHGLAAYLAGDRAAKARGILTLNPVRFVDPLLTVILPIVALVLFGGLPFAGGSTPIGAAVIRSAWKRSAVSLAGPAANLLVAVTIAAAFATGVFDPQTVVGAAFAYLALLELGALLLNLLPIPPLDGFSAAAPLLPPSWVATGIRMGWWGFIAISFVLFRIPEFNAWFWGIAYDWAELLHLPQRAISIGGRLMSGG